MLTTSTMYGAIRCVPVVNTAGFKILFSLPLLQLLVSFYTFCPAWRRLRLAMLDVSLPVMMHQHVDDLFKQIRLLWAEEASRNLVNGLFQLRQSAVISLSMVSGKGQIAKIRRRHIIAGKSEKKKEKEKASALMCAGMRLAGLVHL